MKSIRVVLYVLILTALCFAPLQSVEIAKLEPVQAVWLHAENGKMILETDTNSYGQGATVIDALADMKQNSSGVVYLDTAQYLFVSQSTEHAILSISPHIKSSVYLCSWEGQGSIQEAVKYADAHKIGIKLKNWSGVVKLPELKVKM